MISIAYEIVDDPAILEVLCTLPKEVRKQAKGAYELFSGNPYYPSLHFKRIHATRPIFSVRINIDYRAVGFLEENEITWFWIGSHREYEILIKKLRSA